MRRTLLAASIAGTSSLLLAASSPTIQPGEWEIHTQVTDVRMPGVTPQMLAMMKTKQTIRHCVSAKEAAMGPRDMLNQTKGNCSFTRYTMTGGSIDGAMQCTGKGAMKMTVKGSFTPTSYSTVANMEMTMPQGRMTMTSTGQGKLLGPCKG